MKNKHIDTFITDKLEQGNGLPYKEEYWSDMTRLLDAQMPVTKTLPATAKGITGGLKTLFIAAACVGIAAWYILADSPQTTSESTVTNQQAAQQPQPTAPALTAPAERFNNATASPEKPAEHASVSGAETPTAPTESKVNDNPNAVPTPENLITTTEASSAARPDRYRDKNEGHSATGRTPDVRSNPLVTTESSIPEPLSAQPFALPFHEVPVNQTVTSRAANFRYIDPIAAATPTTLNGNHPATISLIAYPQRNRLIQHIGLAPFMGVVQESGTQTAHIGNINYKHASQSHLAYGINLECATRRFAVRTGIGMSETVLQINGESTRDFYTVDTTFVVVNPHYTNTRSGKPVALVKQQIDSIYNHTEQVTHRGNTQYQYLTVPLTVQYRIPYKRLLMLIEGGVLHHFRIASRYSGSIQLATSDNPVVLPVYNLQLTAGSSLRYAIRSNWAVGVQYNYCLSPSDTHLQFLNNAHVATFMLIRTIR